MPKSIKATRKWWHEGKEHIKAKQIIKDIAKKYGCGCVEEERFEIDLHDIEPELYPKKSLRGYQADLYITKRRHGATYSVVAEVDGGYHDDRKDKDEVRDKAILQKYGIQVVRFQRDSLLVGDYTEQEIVERLGIVG